MAMNYCPTCGTATQPGAGFCHNCGTAFTSQPQQSATPPAGMRQDLARAAMAAQTINVVARLAGIVGGIVGFVLWAMLLYEPMGESNPVLWFLGAFVAGFVGIFLGSRLALMLLAR